MRDKSPFWQRTASSSFPQDKKLIKTLWANNPTTVVFTDTLRTLRKIKEVSCNSLR